MVSDRTRIRPVPALRANGALSVATLLFVAVTSPACANNYGENTAWQFRTSADKANAAAILDMIAKRRGGFYAAPVYNTTIARQVNCSVAASATGNNGGLSAVANAPTVSGASAAALGNQSGTSVAGQSGGTSSSQQSNSGPVSSGVTGATDTSVQGNAWQALNSTQSNGGSQQASVQNSSACSIAGLE